MQRAAGRRNTKSVMRRSVSPYDGHRVRTNTHVFAAKTKPEIDPVVDFVAGTLAGVYGLVILNLNRPKAC